MPAYVNRLPHTAQGCFDTEAFSSCLLKLAGIYGDCSELTPIACLTPTTTFENPFLYYIAYKVYAIKRYPSN